MSRERIMVVRCIRKAPSLSINECFVLYTLAMNIWGVAVSSGSNKPILQVVNKILPAERLEKYLTDLTAPHYILRDIFNFIDTLLLEQLLGLHLTK